MMTHKRKRSKIKDQFHLHQIHSQQMKRFVPVLLFLILLLNVKAQQKTYCNPVNIDYGYTPFRAFSEWGRHRATADPVIVNYKNDYYLFSTNQWGYWWSNDL